jgi:hypothetical protein
MLNIRGSIEWERVRYLGNERRGEGSSKATCSLLQHVQEHTLHMRYRCVLYTYLESYVYVSIWSLMYTCPNSLSLPLFLEHTQSERTCEGGKGVGRRVHCRNVWNKNTKQTNKHTQTLNVSNTMSLKEKKESRRHTWPPGQASELELRRIIQSRRSLAWIILRNSSSDAWARAFSRGAGGGAAAAASWYKGFSFSKSPAITHMSIKHIKYEKYLLRWLFGSLLLFIIEAARLGAQYYPWRTLIIYVICIDVYNDYHKDKQVQKSLPQTTIQKVMKALDLYDVHRKLHHQHKRKRV